MSITISSLPYQERAERLHKLVSTLKNQNNDAYIVFADFEHACLMAKDTINKAIKKGTPVPRYPLLDQAYLLTGNMLKENLQASTSQPRFDPEITERYGNLIHPYLPHGKIE